MSEVIYLVRHGQTQFNVEQRAQGWADSPLTKEGIAQALMLKEWFKEQNIWFSSAYASDLGRAQATMQLIADENTCLYQAAGLREVGFGELDGQKREVMEQYDHDRRVREFGAEPYEDALVRALRTLYWIARNEAAAQTLAVSHSAILAGVYACLPKAENLPAEIAVPNGTILRLEYTPDQLTVQDVIYI
ncbi:MAG: histidine phosphatase family protein [Erysipelotrichaceae bacterium]|nr:histidine phosphatase family protein [Erysipelotrichaceae bacterium]